MWRLRVEGGLLLCGNSLGIGCLVVRNCITCLFLFYFHFIFTFSFSYETVLVSTLELRSCFLFFFFILFPSYYKKWGNGYVVLICLSGLNYSSPERKAQICHHMTSSEICSSWENNNCYRLYTHTMIFLCTWAQGFHFSGWESLLYLWHYSGFSSTLNQQTQ